MTSAKWEAARAARKARRATDPAVQARARQHAEKAARDEQRQDGAA